MSEVALSLTVASEMLLLHPERAVVWPARRTVIVADTHFGKSTVFRQHGLAVPEGADRHDRERLRRLILDVQARRLIVLGDFVHAPLDGASLDAHDFETWCAELPDIDIVVVAGNHDRGVRARWQPPVQWHTADLIEEPFRFTHDGGRPMLGGRRLFTLSGHLHPVARLGGGRRRAPRVPIFWQHERGLVLPSFGLFTGGYVVTPTEGDRVYAVGSQRVVRFL